MKIAIMLTGLARKVQEGYDSSWKGIIENNDVDLYLHAWETKPDGITNIPDEVKLVCNAVWTTTVKNLWKQKLIADKSF